MDSSSNQNTDDPPNKKRKISQFTSQSIIHHNKSSENKRKHKYRTNSKHKNTKISGIIKKEDIEPWWIGQKLIVQVYPKSTLTKIIKISKHCHKIKNKSKLTKGQLATIRDYDPKRKLTHIWFETEDNNYEDVNLSKLEDWDKNTTKLSIIKLPFIPHNDWIPKYWKIKQRVMVKFDGKYGNGQKYAAFIDGYDPISRRHHINYGDTHEWIWANTQRVQSLKATKCDPYIEQKLKDFKINQDEPIPPPWNPIPYGLDEIFEIRSREIEENRHRHIPKKRGRPRKTTKKKNQIIKRT